MQAIAENADCSQAIHMPEGHDTMVATLPAVSEPEEDSVAAATTCRGKQKQKKLVKKPGCPRFISPSNKRPALCFYYFW
jgi:hypothetical protein